MEGGLTIETTDDAAIRARDLTRYYGDLLAVDQISFEVGWGEIFGFLGPNGAGKTTTIHMLTTLLEPSAGDAWVGGYHVTRQAYNAKRCFGIVSEESNIYDELSSWDNLTFTARLYRVPGQEAGTRAADLLETFGLVGRQNDKARLLSRGLRRRLTIAMALIHRPRVLFLDEPTSGLDVQSAAAIRGLVRQLNEAGVTVFLTTHNIEEANRLCHRVAIISDGRIATTDTPENLRATFQSTQSVEVAFQEAARPDETKLSSMPGVSSVVREGNRYRLYTPNPGGLLPHILAYAQEEGLELGSLNTLQPSLEDVFLTITGKEMGTAQHAKRAEEGGPRRGQRRGR
jgi:ABC-2 type transport system ATP-binding protein